MSEQAVPAVLHIERLVLWRAAMRVGRVARRASPSLRRGNVVWLQLIDGVLTLTGSDERVTVEQVIAGSGSGAGSIAVPAQLFTSRVRRLQGAEVELRIDGGALHFPGATSKASLVAITPAAAAAANVQPPWQPITGADSTPAPAVTMAGGFEHIALSIGHRNAWTDGDATAAVIPSAQSIRFVAASRMEVAICDVPVPASWDQDEGGPQLHLSALDVAEVSQHLKEDDDLAFRCSADRIDFTMPGIEVRAALGPSVFPDLAPVTGLVASRRVTCQRSELLDALRLVGLLVFGPDGRVWLAVRPGSIEVRSTDYIGESRTTIACDLVGEPFDIGLRFGALAAMVSGLQGETVVLELDDPTKPVLLQTIERPTYRYFIFPFAVPPPLRWSEHAEHKRIDHRGIDSPATGTGDR